MWGCPHATNVNNFYFGRRHWHARKLLCLTHSPVNMVFKLQMKVFLPSNICTVLLGLIISVLSVFLEEALGVHRLILSCQPINGRFLIHLVRFALHCAVMRGLSIEHAPHFFPTSSMTLRIQLKGEVLVETVCPRKLQRPKLCILGIL